MRWPYSLFLIAALVGGISPARAMVIGREGNTYTIAETDMRVLIQAKAKSFDFEAWKYKELTRISDNISKFRPADAVSGLPASVTGEAYRVDLAYTLSYDIKDVNGNVIYPAGFTFNPLEQLAKSGGGLSKIVVVLNGNNQNELTWFKNKFENYQASDIILLLTDGYAMEISNTLHRPVMYLSELLRQRFNIRETPSVVLQTQRSKYLTVKPYALDQTGKEKRAAKKNGRRQRGGKS